MIKLLLSLVTLIALVAFGVASAEAANPATIDVTVTITAVDLSVSLDETTWAAGALSESGSANTGTEGYFLVTNNSTNRTETFSIIVGSSSPSGWTADTAAAAETFVMKALGGDLTTLTSIDTSQTLETDVAPAGTVDLDLEVTVPSSTAYGGVEQTITVTITAS